eukprot:816929-Rhodomonas_salina.1
MHLISHPLSRRISFSRSNVSTRSSSVCARGRAESNAKPRDPGTNCTGKCLVFHLIGLLVVSEGCPWHCYYQVRYAAGTSYRMCYHQLHTSYRMLLRYRDVPSGLVRSTQQYAATAHCHVLLLPATVVC